MRLIGGPRRPPLEKSGPEIGAIPDLHGKIPDKLKPSSPSEGLTGPNKLPPLNELPPPPEKPSIPVVNETDPNVSPPPEGNQSPESMPQPSDVNKHAPPKPAETNDDVQQTVVESEENNRDLGEDEGDGSGDDDEGVNDDDGNDNNAPKAEGAPQPFTNWKFINLLKKIREAVLPPGDPTRSQGQHRTYNKNVVVPFLQKLFEGLDGFLSEKLQTMVIWIGIDGKPPVVLDASGNPVEAIIFDTNQTARTREIDQPNDHTPAYEAIYQDAEKRLSDMLGRKPLPDEVIAHMETNFPNWKWGNVHGEGGLLHIITKLLARMNSLTKSVAGSELEFLVVGRKVCGYCVRYLPPILKTLRVKKLTLTEVHIAEQGWLEKEFPFEEKLIWEEGANEWRIEKIER